MSTIFQEKNYRYIRGGIEISIMHNMRSQDLSTNLGK